MLRRFLERLLVVWFAILVAAIPLSHASADQRINPLGGIYLLVEANVEDAHTSYLNNLWPDVRDALRAERGVVGSMRLEESSSTELLVRISKQQGAMRALELFTDLETPTIGLGGDKTSSIDVQIDGQLLRITLSEAAVVAINERTMLQTIDILHQRLREFGYQVPVIQRARKNRIEVVVFGVESTSDFVKIVQTTARLTFNPIVSRTRDVNAAAGPGNLLVPAKGDAILYYVIERRNVVSGDDFQLTELAYDQNGRPSIRFQLNIVATQKFADYTRENVGSPIAVVLDDTVISAPVIRSAIPKGGGIITSDFSMEEATNLAVLLQTGALPTSLAIVEQRTISPNLLSAGEQ